MLEILTNQASIHMSFEERLKEGKYWEEKVMRKIPAACLYRSATHDEDMKEGFDRTNLFRNVSIRCRKRNDYYERNKHDFTMRLDSGSMSEFEKLILDQKSDAIIYAYHDEYDVISWMIINLSILRSIWSASCEDGTQSLLYEDKKNALDGSPFRVFNVQKINCPGLVVASSWPIDYSKPKL
jgi:hypothetical protein